MAMESGLFDPGKTQGRRVIGNSNDGARRSRDVSSQLPFPPSVDSSPTSEPSVTSAIRSLRPAQTSLVHIFPINTSIRNAVALQLLFVSCFCFFVAHALRRECTTCLQLDCCHWLGCWSAGFGAWACSITPRQPRSLQFTQINDNIPLRCVQQFRVDCFASSSHNLVRDFSKER